MTSDIDLNIWQPSYVNWPGEIMPGYRAARAVMSLIWNRRVGDAFFARRRGHPWCKLAQTHERTSDAPPLFRR